MSDPTATVTLIAFFLALAVFGLGIVIKRASSPVETEVSENFPTPFPVQDSGIYAPPRASENSPPPIPSEYLPGIPTHFYNRWDWIGIAAILFVFMSLALSNIAASKGAEMKVTVDSLVASIIFQLFIAGCVTAAVIRRTTLPRWLGLRWEKWPWIFLIAPGAVVAIWVLMGGLQAVGYMKWIESLGADSMQEAVKLIQEAKDPWILGLMAVAAVIVAPLCEEIVFRGYLYPVAKKFSGPWAAAIFSGIVFGCVHANLAALLPLSIFGILLAWLYEKTGSIWSVIAVHFCFNGATVAIQMAVRIFNIPIDPP